MRKRGKTDLNQNEIVAVLRAAGCKVQSIASVGDGCPDILVGHAGHWVPMEIKRLGEKLTEAEVKWHAEARAAGCGVPVVYCPEDALGVMDLAVVRSLFWSKQWAEFDKQGTHLDACMEEAADAGRGDPDRTNG